MSHSRVLYAAPVVLLLTFVGITQAGASHDVSFCDAHPQAKQCRSAAPPPGPTTSAPTTSPTTAATSSAPTSSAPTSSAPTSSAPTSTAPTSSAPTSSTPTSSAPTSTATATPSSWWGCTTSAPSGNCGAYQAPGKLVNSNGFNTYVANNCWGDPGCSQTVFANGPADWQIVSTEPRGNTGVRTYPDVQQLFNDWCGNGQWNGCVNPTDTPLSALAALKFGYALSMPPASSGTIAQAAYDIWTSDPVHNEIMIWVDNDNRGNGGATFDAEYTTADGQQWTLYHYGAEIIWSLGARGTYAQTAAMNDVPVAELMKYLVDHGYEQAGAQIGELDFGWEICSSGGSPQTFTMTDYSIVKR